MILHEIHVPAALLMEAGSQEEHAAWERAFGSHRVLWFSETGKKVVPSSPLQKDVFSDF